MSNCINNWVSLGDTCNLWLKDFSLNLTAELMGILLVLFSVNQTVKNSQEKEKNKFKEIAFRQLRYVLRKQIYLLFEMFKATVEVRPDKDYQVLVDLFDDTYFNEVKYLDLLSPAPMVTSQGDEMDWLDYLHSELLSLKSALGQVVDRYSFYLDSEVVDVMEELSDSVFIRFINSIWEAKNINAIGDRGDLLSACKDLLREYATSLLKLMELYNQSAASDRQITMDRRKWNDWWSHNGRPKIGESRIKLYPPALRD
ncbi:MAG: hypothetical protein F6J93_07830 [Oscillatoria sp. SIO1A7]|nr:hypothetical protein [Oscillatoria sp. SIO1A7]